MLAKLTFTSPVHPCRSHLRHVGEGPQDQDRSRHDGLQEGTCRDRGRHREVHRGIVLYPSGPALVVYPYTLAVHPEMAVPPGVAAGV